MANAGELAVGKGLSRIYGGVLSAVGPGAGAGSRVGSFAQLRQEVAGFDLELVSEFPAAPGAAGLVAHDRHDAMPAGRWLGRAGGVRVAAGPVRQVDGRGTRCGGKFVICHLSEAIRDAAMNTQ
jgi:hypothetical protein